LDDIFPTDDWCSAARKMETNIARLQAGSLYDPTIAELASGDNIEMTNQALAVAPPELVAPLEGLLQAQTAFASELAAVGWQRADLDASAFRAAGPSSRAAIFALDQYNFETCGFENGFDPANDPALRPQSTEPQRTGTLRTRTAEGYVSQGFTAAEATCITQSMDFGNFSQYQSFAGLEPLLAPCGIGEDRAAEIFG